MRKELILILVLLAGGAFLAYNWAGNSPLTFFAPRGPVNIDNNSKALPAIGTPEAPAGGAKPAPVHGRGPASGTKPQRPTESTLPLTTTALPVKKMLAVNCCAETNSP